jgi:hypothetical protein
MLLRRWNLCAIAVLAGGQGCYEYVPVDSPSTSAVGKLVELKITDPGRVSLAPRFGPGLDRVEGRLVAERQNELTLSVLSVTSLEGENTKWSGESVSLDRGFIRTVSSRRLSTTRTAILAVAAGAVLYFTAGRALTGGGKDPPEQGGPANPPVSQRIPIGIRIRAIP